MTFTGSDLRALRDRHGATVTSIAVRLGVHRNTWAKLERDLDGEVPKVLRLALAAWTRGLPAMGDE